MRPVRNNQGEKSPRKACDNGKMLRKSLQDPEGFGRTRSQPLGNGNTAARINYSKHQKAVGHIEQTAKEAQGSLWQQAGPEQITEDWKITPGKSHCTPCFSCALLPSTSERHRLRPRSLQCSIHHSGGVGGLRHSTKINITWYGPKTK